MNIKKKMLAVMAALSVGAASWAQEPLRIPVWPNGPAEDNGITAEEKITKEGRVVNSRTAELFVYLPAPEKNTGAAVVICPGGGYARQAMQHEGTMFAQMLVDKGVAGIILKYRLPNGHHAIPLADAQEAMRVVRQHADEWKINPSKVGIAGFSAGGHVASTLGTHCDSTCRPDFMILFYPVVTMGELTHAGSRDNLLGDQKNDAALVACYSNELQVSASTPPALFLLSDDDKSVPPANSVQMYLRMKELGIPSAMYIFPEGGHGWGCRPTFAYYEQWTRLMWRWLQNRQFIP